MFLLLLPPLVASQLVSNPTYPPHGCHNYGLCNYTSDPTENSYTSCPAPGSCKCLNGTTGSFCETISDTCTADACPTVGEWSCNSTITGPVCSCQAGWTGDQCDLSISDPCANSPCKNGGVCSTPENSTTAICTCPTGYLKPHCLYQSPCEPKSPCNNNGTCTDLYNGQSYVCTCKSLYYGRNCETYNRKYDISTASAAVCLAYDAAVLVSPDYLVLNDGNSMSIDKCQTMLAATFHDPPYEYMTLSGKNCYLSVTNKLNATAMFDSACDIPCKGNTSQKCGKENFAVQVIYEPPTGAYPLNCTNSKLGDPCHTKEGWGTCVSVAAETNAAGYLCICKGPTYVAATDSFSCIEYDLCNDTKPCAHGTCHATTDQSDYTCTCLEGYTGRNCDVELLCNSTTCLYGGTCENTGTSTTCHCLPNYFGDHCENINICNYSNPCIHGDCYNNGTGIQVYPYCVCATGWTGEYCDRWVDKCEQEPCVNNGTCAKLFNDYNCTCVLGTSGKNCDTIENFCYKNSTNKTGALVSQCNTRDNKAVCVSGTYETIGKFRCDCGADWLGDLCDLNVIIKDVLMALYGTVDMTMLPLLNDLMNTPAQISDMMPFMIGTLSAEARMNMSWSVQDMFNWAAYEEKELKLSRDFYQWNDVVLGNCFTFNHPNGSELYRTRSSQSQGGLRVRLRLNQDEYAYWTDTAAILVFIHFKDSYIMSESTRYSAEPNNEVIFFPHMNEYTRLGGQYGTCVKSISEVKAFYFPGAYTTDGCLRSCYQDMIQRECDCMDPRYPMAADATPCVVTNMSCIDHYSAEYKDPSKWPDCICPLPCTNTDYAITWTKNNYRAVTPNCLYKNQVDELCQSETADSVTVVVNQPKLVYNLFQETPAMDFNKLIGNLGALLGVLMGVCAMTFIEIAVMIFRVVWSLMCKPR